MNSTYPWPERARRGDSRNLAFTSYLMSVYVSIQSCGPEALSGRHDDALVNERCAADESVPPAALPFEQRAHVRPLPERGRRPGQGRDAVAELVLVVPPASGPVRRKVNINQSYTYLIFRDDRFPCLLDFPQCLLMHMRNDFNEHAYL